MEILEEIFDFVNYRSDSKVNMTVVLVEKIEVIKNHSAVIK